MQKNVDFKRKQCVLELSNQFDKKSPNCLFALKVADYS